MTEAISDAALAAYARAVPGVIGNPYMVHFPHPRQAVLLAAHQGHDYSTGTFKALFGGAVGGGKSDALLMAAAQFFDQPHYRAVILRRTFAEMAKPGAIMDRAKRWWRTMPGVRWNSTDYKLTFPSGAELTFGYHDHPDHDTKYQGGEYHFVGFDELTHWPTPDAWDWLGTRVRKNTGDPIPLRQLATSNPGQAGHSWVKAMFVGGVDADTGAKLKPRHLFIQSKIDDNPSLDKESYLATLDDMHPTKRAQLRDGDWDAREPGDYFRAEWFGTLLDPHECPEPPHARAVRWWDLAASESDSAAYTAGVRMVRQLGGALAVTHAVKFRKHPGARDDLIVEWAKRDGPGTVVGLEIEPGSGGVAQFDGLASRLKEAGFRVAGARPNHSDRDRDQQFIIRGGKQDASKEARADPVAACLFRGFVRRGEGTQIDSDDFGRDAGKAWNAERSGIRLYSGGWVAAYLDELEGFPGAAVKDWVDATSGAYAWHRARPTAAERPPRKPAPIQAHRQMDVHPTARMRDDGPRRWRP